MKSMTLRDGRVIEYHLTVKNVKNINVRIKNDGCVYVSASGRVPTKKIEDFLAEKADFIIRATEKYKGRTAPEYNDGDTVKILGEDILLSVREGKKSVSLVGDELRLCLPDVTDTEVKRALLERLYTEICREVIPPMLDRMYGEYFKGRGVKFPTVKFRKMKSRWGSCHSAKGIVTFSTSLGSVGVECIELVVAHELCHLLHSDHSSRFYSTLGELIPDHKQRKALLRSYNASF